MQPDTRDIRKWDWHPTAVHMLLIHTLIQAVKDASETHKVDWDWLMDARFDHWVEMANIDCESARTALVEIADGKRGTSPRVKASRNQSMRGRR